MLALALLLAVAPPTAPALDHEGVQLPEGAIRRLGSSRWRPGSFAINIAWSPDGKWIVTRNQLTSTYDVWDARTGVLVNRMAGYRRDGDGGKVGGPMVFSPDGRIAFSRRGRYAHVVEVPSGRVVSVLAAPGDAGTIHRLAFDAGGAALVTVGGAGELIRWRVSDGLLLSRAESPRGTRASGPLSEKPVLSADGRLVSSVVHLETDIISVRRTATGKEVFRRSFDLKTDARPEALSPDGSLLVVRTLRGYRCLDTSSGKELWSIDDERNEDEFAGFSPDGKLAALCRWPDSSRVIDARTGKSVVTGLPHRMPHAGAFSPDGRKMVIEKNQALFVYDLKTGKPGDIGTGPKGHYDGAGVLTPDGKSLLTGGLVAGLWDLETGKVKLYPEAGSFRRGSLAVGPDGTLAAGFNEEETLVVWNLATGAIVRRFKGGGVAQNLTFGPEGRTVFGRSGGDSSTWDLRTGVRADTEAPRDEKFVPTTGHIAEAVHGPRTVYRMKEGERLTRLDLVTGETIMIGDIVGKSQTHIQPLAGGKYLGVADGELGRVEILDAKTGKCVRRFRAPRVNGLASSADGRYVAATSGVLVWLWDLETGRATTPFAPHDDGAGAVHLPAGGKFLVTGGRGGRLVWDLKRIVNGPAPVRRLPAGVWHDHWICMANPDGVSPSDGDHAEWLVATREQTMEELPDRIKADIGEFAARRAPQVVEVLRRIDTAEARGLLKRLADGPPGSPYTAAAKKAE